MYTPQDKREGVTSIRHLMVALFCSWLWMPPAFAGLAVDGDIQVHRLGKRVLVLTADNPSFNNLTAVSTEKGIVVIDTTTSPALAAKLKAIVARELGRDDFIYTINTHHHWDHVFGNQAFKETTIISHARTPENIRKSIPPEGHPAPWLTKAPVDQRRAQLQSLDPKSKTAKRLEKEIAFFLNTYQELLKDFDVALPTVTFADHLTLDLGDLTLDLYSYGNADTDNSLIVHVPEEGLVVVGDLYWTASVFSYFGDESDVDIPRWIDVLGEVVGNEHRIQWVVAGHLDIWSGEHLELRYRYISELWAAVEKAKKAGLNLEEAKQQLTMDRFSYLERLKFKEYYEKKDQLDQYKPEVEHLYNVEVFWKQE
jgi:glyoxylase-like metal-dependent hydrolase (beta-lactamase superfamily II)